LKAGRRRSIRQSCSTDPTLWTNFARPKISTPSTSPLRLFPSEHFAKAAASGKHIYLEKPVAIDVPGARRVIATGEKVGTKASVAVGFQLRHATPYVQLRERIQKGQLGDVVCGLSHYYATQAADRKDWDNSSADERRLRNWIHDKVLSGDILVEQNIHLIDFQ